MLEPSTSDRVSTGAMVHPIAGWLSCLRADYVCADTNKTEACDAHRLSAPSQVLSEQPQMKLYDPEDADVIPLNSKVKDQLVP